MNRKHILIGICGSFCNHSIVLDELEKIKEYELTFVLSKNVSTLSTRFMTQEELRNRLSRLTNNPLIETLVDAEKVGPFCKYDLMMIAPCTATCLSRLTYGNYDCPVALSAKAMLRNKKNLLLAIATNDGIGISGINLMTMLQRKRVYVVPMYQDDIVNKENSLIADFSKIEKSISYALENKQLQPVLGEIYET